MSLKVLNVILNHVLLFIGVIKFQNIRCEARLLLHKLSFLCVGRALARQV